MLRAAPGAGCFNAPRLIVESSWFIRRGHLLHGTRGPKHEQGALRRFLPLNHRAIGSSLPDPENFLALQKILPLPQTPFGYENLVDRRPFVVAIQRHLLDLKPTATPVIGNDGSDEAQRGIVGPPLCDVVVDELSGNAQVVIARNLLSRIVVIAAIARPGAILRKCR